jgi:hypothetical protein
MAAASTKVQGVKAACLGDGRALTPIEVDSNDPIFSGGKRCPISKKLGISVIVRKCENVKAKDRDQLQNQMVTYMMAEAGDGFAPMDWQDYVGNVIFVREDKKPLDVKELQSLFDYHSSIMDAFGDGEEEAHEMMRPLAYEKFKTDYN